MKMDTQNNNVESLEDSNDPGKMFIGGLSWQTTPDGLKEYFGNFGEVADSIVMKDPITKRSRGFGFIKFTDPSSVDKVLSSPTHIIDEKKVDPKVAVPKKNKGPIAKTKKIFVGGLASDTKLEDMQKYFESFGKVEEAQLMFDKQTQRHRGFGFVTFTDPDTVDRVCEIHFHEINDKVVECKKAQPKEVMAAQTPRPGINPSLLTILYGGLNNLTGTPTSCLLPHTAAATTAENGPGGAMFAMWPHLMPLATHAHQQPLYDNNLQNHLMLTSRMPRSQLPHQPAAARRSNRSPAAPRGAAGYGNQFGGNLIMPNPLERQNALNTANHTGAATYFDYAANPAVATTLGQLMHMPRNDALTTINNNHASLLHKADMHRNSAAVLNGFANPYQQAAAAAATQRAFQPAGSPGPLEQLYTQGDMNGLSGYGQATSPQPNTGFPNFAGYGGGNHNGGYATLY